MHVDIRMYIHVRFYVSMHAGAHVHEGAYASQRERGIEGIHMQLGRQVHRLKH